MFLHEKGACQNDMKAVSLQLYGFAYGPVQNCFVLLAVMDHRNVCVLFMARNCRFPKVGTHGCQRGNHRSPLQGTASSQR